jgi:hypothetical protein
MKSTIIKTALLAIETITATEIKSNLCRQATKGPDRLWYLNRLLVVRGIYIYMCVCGCKSQQHDNKFLSFHLLYVSHKLVYVVLTCLELNDCWEWTLLSDPKREGLRYSFSWGRGKFVPPECCILISFNGLKDTFRTPHDSKRYKHAPLSNL